MEEVLGKAPPCWVPLSGIGHLAGMEGPLGKLGQNLPLVRSALSHRRRELDQSNQYRGGHLGPERGPGWAKVTQQSPGQSWVKTRFQA